MLRGGADLKGVRPSCLNDLKVPMEPELQLAWTRVITADDYDEHMAAIGQAQASAALTVEMIRVIDPPVNSRIVVAGAGTGQMFDFVDAGLFRPFTLICTDLNPKLLGRLKQRVIRQGLSVHIAADDIENTALASAPHLLLVTLVLEHIDWRKGVEAIAKIGPMACGVIIQENPQGMASAVTPGRCLPGSIEAAVRFAHPTLISHSELLHEFEQRGYNGAVTRARHVADGKRLVSTLFLKSVIG